MMSWFKIHPEWLTSESEQLKTSSIYKQNFQYLDKLFVSCGEIIIRLKETKKFPILFVYPESTPYLPPKVYLLKNLLAEDEIKEISKLKEDQIEETLKEKVKFVFLRHQNSDGSICIVESDNLYKESAQIYQVEEIIKRIRDWLISIETEKIPFDSAEVELFAHFKDKNYNYEFLLPSIFYDSEIVQGEFYATLNPIFLNLKKIYFGVSVIGENISGVSINPKYYQNSKYLMYTRTPNPIEILTNNKKIKELLNKEDLIEGNWYDITTEPTPFQDTSKIISYIGGSSIDKGLNKIYRSKLFKKIQGDKIIWLGLRFVNRRGDKEWTIFRLTKDLSSLILNPEKKDIPEMLKKYNIEAVFSEQFTEESHHKRNIKRAERSLLSKKGICIIGCGALGSEIADCLGKAGIGKINLIDNESFKAHNAIRHIIGLDQTGIPKAAGVQLKLLFHNPFVNINYQVKDISKLNIYEYIYEDSIGISSLADDNLEAFINEQAVINNKIIFYSRVLRGGKAARIMRVIPGEDACLNCLSLYSQEENEKFIQLPEDKSLPTITNECNNPIRPASAADIKLTASLTSRIIIDFLQNKETSKNHWVFFSEDLPGLQYNSSSPFSVYSTFIEPHQECVFCKKNDKIKINILKEAFNFMLEEVKKSNSIETGGVLIGHKDNNQNIFVKKVTGPGPKAIRKPNWFEKDIEYCQKELIEEYEKFEDKGVYVGEWHYHPSPINIPSCQDLKSLSEITASKNYIVDEPIMIIFSSDKKVSCTIHPFNKTFYFTEYTIIEEDIG